MAMIDYLLLGRQDFDRKLDFADHFLCDKIFD